MWYNVSFTKGGYTTPHNRTIEDMTLVKLDNFPDLLQIRLSSEIELLRMFREGLK